MFILLAEDSPTERLLVERLLSNLGHEVVTAQDGDEAWALFLERRLDVIISDWNIPHCSGLELCKRVRDHGGPYTNSFCSLATKSMNQLEGIEAGADDYLVKPLNKRIHGLKMRLIVAERLNGLHQQLRMQQSELESLNEQLYRDGRLCALTGIANRLQLNEDIRKLHALTHRHQEPFSFAGIFDIDHFKSITIPAVTWPEMKSSVRWVPHSIMQREVRQSISIWRRRSISQSSHSGILTVLWLRKPNAQKQLRDSAFRIQAGPMGTLLPFPVVL